MSSFHSQHCCRRFFFSLFLMQGKNPNHHALHVSSVAHICFVLTISYTMQRLVLCCAIFFSHLTQPAYLSDKGHAQDIILLRSIPCICLLLYLCLIKGTPCIRFLKGTDTLDISHRRHTLYLFLLRAHLYFFSKGHTAYPYLQRGTPCMSLFPKGYISSVSSLLLPCVCVYVTVRGSVCVLCMCVCVCGVCVCVHVCMYVCVCVCVCVACVVCVCNWVCVCV